MADHPYKITEVFIKEEREDITDSPPRLTDDKQDSGIYKNRSGKPLNRGQKIMAFNVFKSHFNKGTNKSQSVKFTASQIGISERSVWSIVKEHETTGDLSSPSNKRPRPQADEKLNEEQKSTLRLIVHSFFLKNEPPTLNKLLEVVRLDDTIPTIGRTTLWKLLKKLGFKYEKRGKTVYILDGRDLHARWSDDTQNVERSDHSDDSTSSFLCRKMLKYSEL